MKPFRLVDEIIRQGYKVILAIVMLPMTRRLGSKHVLDLSALHPSQMIMSVRHCPFMLKCAQRNCADHWHSGEVLASALSNVPSDSFFRIVDRCARRPVALKFHTMSYSTHIARVIAFLRVSVQLRIAKKC